MIDPGAFHVVLLSVAAVVAAGLAAYAWRHRDQPGAVPLSAAMVAVTAWIGTEVVALSQTGASHLVWERVQWAAIAVVPLLFFLFIMEFTGHDWALSRRVAPLLFVLPAVTVVMVWTNPAHHLMWTDPVHHHVGGIVTLSQEFGPWFWVYFAYAYSLMLLGFVLLLRLVTVSEYLYLDQTVLIVVGILAPLAGNALSVFELAPLPGLDLTPYGFTVTGIAFGNALFRYRLFDLLPATRRLGRQAALSDLNDGVVIVGTEGNVLYLNPAAGDILGCEPSAALGEPARDLVDAERLDLAATERLAELTLAGRVYEVETAPISDRRGRRVGHTVLLYDVTERTRRERELRTQRDRLRRLQRINTVVREVNQALVDATTIAELRRAVADTLATPGLYDDVWITTTATDGPPTRKRADEDAPRRADEDAPGPPDGRPGPPTDAPTPRTGDGDGPGLDVPAGGPGAGAGDGDGNANGNGNANDEWTTVALVHGRTALGALALRTGREAGFGRREREVLDELGETIGHAITTIERTRLLVADTRVEVDLRCDDDEALLVGLADATGVDWTLDGVVPAGAGTLVAYLSTDGDVEVEVGADADVGVEGPSDGDAPAPAVDAAASRPGVADARRLSSEGDDGVVLELEVRADGRTLARPLVDLGANLVTATATAADGCCRATVEVPPDETVRAVVERVRATFPATTLTARREVDPTDREALPDETGMTDRQREALEAAYRAGYFESPRASTAEEVAATLDIASPTLHGHLRKAERRLLDVFFEE